MINNTTKATKTEIVGPSKGAELDVLEPEDQDQPELCRERCAAKLIKNKVVHECILHKGHIGNWGQHICNCGISWVSVDLE